MLVCFLPQSPYCPIGSLTDVLTYPVRLGEARLGEARLGEAHPVRVLLKNLHFLLKVLHFLLKMLMFY